ncbi:MAG: hypothetical protein ACPGSC_08240, partial [Granulosicoccaceae bacterium]
SDIELPESNNHFVLVRSRNRLGVSSWSRVSFHVTDLSRELPPVVSITSPEDKSTVSLGSDIEFVWMQGAAANDSSVATGFDVYIYDRTQRAYVVTERNMDAASLCDESGVCRYALSSDIELPESNNHFVLVRSRNRLGVSSWNRINFHIE